MTQAQYDNSLLTTRKAAAMLGVSLRSVQLWCDAGKLTYCLTAGGHRRISRESVAQRLALVTRNATAASGTETADAESVLRPALEAALSALSADALRQLRLVVAPDASSAIVFNLKRAAEDPAASALTKFDMQCVNWRVGYPNHCAVSGVAVLGTRQCIVRLQVVAYHTFPLGEHMLRRDMLQFSVAFL